MTVKCIDVNAQDLFLRLIWSESLCGRHVGFRETFSDVAESALLIVMRVCIVGSLGRSTRTPVYLYTQQNVREYPDTK